MIGRFLEWSAVTGDIRASLDFYRRIGFTETAVGEAWPHPYAVVTDGRIHVGLHQAPDFAPSATFVQPGLLGLFDRLDRLGFTFEFKRLADDAFNEIGWLDPCGHLVRIVEARTFSPSERRATDTSLCGYFTEIGLPVPNAGAAAEHWERCGFVGMDEPDGLLPHVSCTSDTVDVGLYQPIHVEQPALVFETPDLETALRALSQAGVDPDRQVPPAFRRLPAARLRAPEGTLILISAAWANPG